MADMDRIIQRLVKIKALADSGVGGERETARLLLKDVARRYGIDLDNISTPKEQVYEMNMREGWKLDLALQIFGLMRLAEYGSLDAPHCRIVKHIYYRRPYKLFAICTELQWVELNAKLDILAKDYQQQLAVFFRAFLEANDLLVPADVTKPPTDEEVETAIAAMKMAPSIKKSVIRKQISSGLHSIAPKKLSSGK